MEREISSMFELGGGGGGERGKEIGGIGWWYFPDISAHRKYNTRLIVAGIKP